MSTSGRLALFRWKEILIYSLVAIAIWLPRGLDSDKFVTIDEPQWLYRSANFYYSLAQRDFGSTSPAISQTVQVMSPGIVTMWAETIAYLIEFPEYRGFGQGLLSDPSQLEKFLESKGVSPFEILVTGRLVLTLWNTAILLIAFVISRRLFGLWVSLVGFLLIAFEPYHIALTKIAHLDGPLSGVMLLSVLAILAYAYKGRKISYLFLSGLAFGAALLTKLPALLLVPYVGLLFLTLILIDWRTQSEEQSKHFHKRIKILIGHLIIWGGIALFVLLVFWPEMWVDPIGTLSQFLQRPFFHTRFSQNNIFGNTTESNFAGINWQNILWYIPSYLWRTTPIAILGLLAAGTAYFSRIGLFVEQKMRNLFLALILFVIVFGVFVTIASTKANRYIIPIYLPLDLIAAMGWVAITIWFKETLPTLFRKHSAKVFLTGVVMTQLFLAVRTHPYYFSYYNPLLGGSRAAGEFFERGIGLGEGLDQAARYLNDKPESDNLRVRSWYYSGPFSYFFVGTVRGISERDEWSAERIVELKEAHYIVTYINQWKRRLPERLLDALAPIPPEQVIWINEIEYVRIYAVHDLPTGFFELLLKEEGE